MKELRHSFYKIEKSGQHYNLYYDNHHFLTIINQIGTFNLRAHPGIDPNGWGTSVYIQPFFPGAEFHSARIYTLQTDSNYIKLQAGGKICKGKDETLGSWNLELKITYDKETEIVYSTGSYHIDLPDSLQSLKSGDLNLLRIASNYLVDVPLIGGGIGNTGDMTHAEFTTTQSKTEWHPHYRDDTILWQGDTAVTMRVHGNFNEFDSVAQGFDPIPSTPAEKPGIELSLKDLNNTDSIAIFGMFSTYRDNDASDQYGRDIFLYEEYWQDNIGITPIIMEETQNHKFSYAIDFRSLVKFRH